MTLKKDLLRERDKEKDKRLSRRGVLYREIKREWEQQVKEFKKKTTVGIRVPDNAIALEIVRQLGNPIVSSSIHDEDAVLEYSTDPELIFEKWQNLVDIVIDGGYGDNIGSTIIDLSGFEPVVIREGKGSLEVL